MIAAIADCLAQSLSGDPWHGPSLDVLLADVTPDQAVAQHAAYHAGHVALLKRALAPPGPPLPDRNGSA